MDPNANLEEQRELALKLQEAAQNDGPNEICKVDVSRLCDLVEALDGWISGGGFLPRAWHHAQEDRKTSKPLKNH